MGINNASVVAVNQMIAPHWTQNPLKTNVAYEMIKKYMENMKYEKKCVEMCSSSNVLGPSQRN